MALWDSDKARGQHEMSVDEFKKWLMSFDSDKDGRISRKELRAAVRSCGARFFTKSGRGMKEADTDGDGFIQEHEIDSLLNFAQNNMGIKFI